MKKIYFLLLTILFAAFSLNAQTTLISPTGDGGFENGATLAANGWTAVNGATNQWFVGSVAVSSAGTNSAYISNQPGGTTYNYLNTASSTVHFYRDVTFPAGETNIVLSFKWKATGESSYDYVTVYSMPTSVTPTFNTPAGGFQSWLNIPTAYSGAVVHAVPPSLNLQAEYVTQTICLPAAYAGTTRRLVFMWSNDGSSGGPQPGSIDEISLVSSLPPAAPANQPTGLVLTSLQTAINGSFTAAAGGASGYLVVRYPTGSVPTNPVNGTTYVAGNSLGLGKVVSTGASTSFSATGITGTFDFYVYSYNAGACNTTYLTSSPLFGTQSTLLTSGFSGVYTINPDAPASATNFITWTDAVTSLNILGVIGPTTFTVTGTAATVTFNEGNLLLGGPYISGVPSSLLLTSLSATNTLSFVAGAGKTINMSGTGINTTIDYVFRLMGVDYVTFDGINIVDVGATVTTQYEFGYVIGNAAVSDGATNNTIKNFSATLFKTNTGQANGPYGVLVQNGTTVVSALGTTGTNASRNNNNKIQNFTINGAKRGVTFSGLAIPAFDEGNEVSGPAFTSAAGGTWVGGSRITNGGGSTSGTDWGVGIDGQKNMKVFNVQIDNFIETNASPALSGIHFGTAASTALGSDNTEIYNCVIHNLENNLSTTSGVIGIRSSGTGLQTLKVYNNAIYDLRATIATGANVIVGAFLTSSGAGSKFELYNNSINLPGALAAAGISKGFGLAGVVGTVVTAKNNAINFGTTGGGSTGGVIALDFGAISPTLLDFSSNIYNVGTPSAARRVAVYGSANRSALIDWQSTMAIANGSSAGVDQRAGYGNPGFVSGTDLTYGASNSVENSGLPISGLLTANDILGVARNASTPDLGIFEGSYATGFVDVAAPGVVIDNFNRGSQAAEIRVTVSDNVNTVGNITARLWYRLGVAGAFTALPPNVAPGSTNNGEYRWGTSIRALAQGTYQYYIIVKDAANNYFANPTMAPGSVSPGFATAPDPNWAGANPFASAGFNTFVVNGAPLAGGTYTVGATETYATLTAVAAELSSRPLSGNVVFELTNNYTGAGETFPIVFNQPSYTVAGPLTITIRPAAGVVTERVTSGDPGASNGVIVLDGMRDMTLDGRPGGVGSSRMWRITNSRDGVGSLIGPAMLLQNDALRNTIKYLTLQSNSNTGSLGVINIGFTYYGGIGNSLNTIDNCDIGPNTAGTLVVPPNPVRGIAAVGGGTNSYNNGNTYSNNNIHDFHNTASSPVGIFVAGETGVTITGNSIYQTAARSGWAAFGLGIAVNGATGPGINISNNFIGGSAPLCAGGPMTISATTFVFYGIQVNTGLYTSASTISNNTFTNMNFTSANTTSTSGSVIVCGINPVTNSNQYPINITNNTIGNTSVDATTSPAIVFTSTSTAASSIFSGVFGSVTGGILNFSNNNIGGVRLVATGTGGTTFIGIQHQTAGVAATIDNNLIGSLATANNIVQNSNAAVSGIVNTSTLSLSNALITNNTIANITYNAAVAGTSQTFTGISGAGSAPLTINSNTIRDIVGNNHATLTGITMTSSGIGTIIRGNTIRNWTINPQTASTSITVQGIYTFSSTSTGVIEKNVIRSLINGSTSTGSNLYGTNNQWGANWTYSNNMISLGTGSNGDIIIRGIYDFSTPTAVTGGINYYYNTVSITGAAAGGTNNTYAYNNVDGSGVGLKSFRNNIFSNTRSSGTGLGYAISHSNTTITAANISSNYNDLYSATTVAQWQGTAAGNNYTFAGWQAITVGDANSKSVLPVFISATDLHLSTAAGANWCLNGSGVVITGITDDIDGNIRSVGVAPLGSDMGADEFVATGSDIATPSSQTKCSGTAITTIVLSGGATSYSWTRDNTVAATGIAASGTGDISGTLTNTTTAPVTVTFTITALDANACAAPATFTATVLVNPTPTAVAAPASQTVCSGVAITNIAITGNAVSGVVYNWTRDNTVATTGIAASGAGNISGTLTNTTAAPVTVTFTITPTANGCAGTPVTATVLVNPTPTAVATPSSQTVCSATPITTIVITGNAVAGVVYNWTRDNTVAVTGISASGAGNISGTLTNTTTAPVTVTFTITPTANGCPGAAITATVLVNPLPIIGSSQVEPTTCVSADGSITLTLSGAAGPYTFAWTGSDVNPTSQNQTGLIVGAYSVIVTAANGCTATANFALAGPGGCSICPTLTTFTTTPSGTACSGSNVTLTASGLTGMGITYGILFKYSTTVLANPYIGGTTIATIANGALTSGGTVATANTTTIPVGNYVLYAILTPTPIDPVCRPALTVVDFSVGTTPTVNAVANQTFCNNSATTAVTFSGFGGDITYNWTNNTPSIGLAASGTGNIASFTATNATNAPVVATITVTPTRAYNFPSGPLTCTGTPITYTYTVNPIPTAVATPSTQTVCSGVAITTIAITGNAVAGVVYNWTRDNTVATTGIAASGAGDISGTLTNTTTAPVTVTFTITPTANGCAGTPITSTVLVNPTPTAVATPSSQTLCSATPITTIVITGNAVAGVVYNWTRDNTVAVTGIAASGTGNSIAGTLTNTTALPVTVTFTITPTANGCAGLAITATVLVNPIPNAIATPAAQTICNGVAITPIVLTSGTPGTTFTWTRNNTTSTTAPGGIPASGSGNTITGFMINTTFAPITVTFTITPTFAGCVGTPVTATVTIQPTPTAAATPATQVSCSGAPIATINLTGLVAGTVYNWTRDNVVAATGIAASGTGNISGTLTTTVNTPVVVTFTITPSINGCNGPSIIAIDTIYPTPSVNQPVNQVVCNGGAITAVTFTGTVAGTTFNWTNTTPSIGLAATGTGNIPVFTAVNTTNAPVTATITVTPVLTSTGCVGVAKTFTITVNPTATVGVVPNQTLCTGSSTAAINFTSTVAGTTFSWTNNTPSIGLAASGTGNIPSFTAINTTPTAVTATITVTPNTAAGCIGVATTVTITVNGNSVAPTGATSSVVANCGPTSTTLTVVGGALGTGASWRWYSASCGGTLVGTGASITIPVNTTTTYFVRAEGTCNTTGCGTSVTVTINTIPTISIAAAPFTALTPLLRTNLTATVNPTAVGNVVEWFKDNGPLPIATGLTLTNINVDQLGSYRARVTTAQGCTATSNTIEIRDSATGQLFVYPNPNNGKFQIRYYLPENSISVVRKVAIFDSKGALVYNQRLSVQTRWGSVNINILGVAQGSYFIKILDVNDQPVVGARVQVLR